MNYHVFVSHSSQDKDSADAVCAILETSGLRCWIAPRDLIPGRGFAGEIKRGIEACRVFVLVFSSHANTSPYVLREVQLAARNRLHIVNFRIEKAALSDDLEFYLSVPHWLDAFKPPIERHHKRLLDAVKTLIALDYHTEQLDGEEKNFPTLRRNPAPRGKSPARAVNPLWNSIWKNYKKSKGKKRAEWLRKAAENGDPRVAGELKKHVDSQEMFWAAVAYPIPEFIDVAIQRLTDSQGGFEASELLDRAVKLIPHLIKPEHLASVVGTAEYMCHRGYSRETSEHFGTMIWFLRFLVKRNPSLRSACKQIIQRILILDLNPCHLTDCLQAFAEFESNEAMHEFWRKHCLEQRAQETPAVKGGRDYYNSGASYFLEALESLAMDGDADAVVAQAKRFLDSKNIDELWNAIKILKRAGVNLPTPRIDGIISKLSKLDHNYADETTERITRMVESIRA